MLCFCACFFFLIWLPRIPAHHKLHMYSPTKITISTLSSISHLASSPSKITHLTFSDHFDQEITSPLPSSLTHLTLGAIFNYSLIDIICAEKLPNLQHLILGPRFNSPLPTLSSSLKYLELGISFSQPVFTFPSITHLIVKGDWFSSSIPASVTHLTLQHKPDNFISLPPLLLSLDLGDGFAALQWSLPPTLKYLRFGHNFNNYISTLPSSLTHLTFGSKFNRVINLPPYLTHLEFGDDFNQPIVFPSTLLQAKFGSRFNQHIDHFPACLVSLEFGHDFFRHLDNLPASLKHLVLGQKYSITLHLPSSLTQLVVGTLVNIFLPPSITHLTFNVTNIKLKQTFNCLPSLNYLCERYGKLGADINTEFPSSLTHLELGISFNSPLTFLPPNLTHLTLGQQFRQPIDKMPLSLTYLELGDFFNEPVAFPPSLTHLTLGLCTPTPSDRTASLPTTLKFLQLHSEYSINLGPLPPSLHSVKFYVKNKLDKEYEKTVYFADCPLIFKHHLFTRTKHDSVVHSLVWFFQPQFTSLLLLLMFYLF